MLSINCENVQREIKVEDILVQRLSYVGQNISQSVYMCNNSTKLLIAVISHVDDIKGRKLIRRTWGNHSLSGVEIRFVVGYTKNNRYSSLIANEQLIYKDLVITNIEENYYDLSLKSLAVVGLATDFCPSAFCVAKSDDDNIINIKTLKHFCEANKDTESIHGYCLKDPKVLRRGLITSTKWDIPYFVYPLKRYPYYCRGGHYLITGKSTTKKLIFGLKMFGFFKSLNLQRMPEDGIFTGFAAEIAGIKRISNSLFIPCLGENGGSCIDEMPYPSDWISVMIGNKKGSMENLDKC
uniref:Hexosyltransferase n=1 Tax=Panagrolaimus sp. ES5 TaxID=591445 RepID=A0AC34FJW4_9BILA